MTKGRVVGGDGGGADGVGAGSKGQNQMHNCGVLDSFKSFRMDWRESGFCGLPVLMDVVLGFRSVGFGVLHNSVMAKSKSTQPIFQTSI